MSEKCFKVINNKAKEKIAVYFYGGLKEVYQIKQWLSFLHKLNNTEKIQIVVRNKYVHSHLRKITNISVIYINTINQLMTFYEKIDFKVVLYVNNGMKNFQSLIYHRSLHIHLNHGESEKSSMHSNQSKAYDYVYIVGEAAYDRYQRHIINKQFTNYVKVGRPQFDFIHQIAKNFNRKTILYAPTDESTHISMRYTSIERLGMKIVDSILANSEYQLVYRPHPSTGKNDATVNKINNEIITKVTLAENGCIEKNLDAIDLLSVVDLAIFDNSSLIIDFLNFEKPMFATDMFSDEYHDVKSFKMLDACIMLNEDNIDSLDSMISSELIKDSLKEKKQKVKSYYLGEYKKDESSNLVIKKILEAMDERDRLLEEKNMLGTIH